jgi:phosphoribosyl 1,2-cyclic phosphodiesterase
VRLSILGSGSAGNALYVEAGETRVLVDAGLPVRELCRRLECVPGAPSPEEHSDHAGHAASLIKRGLRAFGTEGTLRALELPIEQTTAFDRGRPFAVGELEVTPVGLPHDAADPVGFRLFADGASVGVVVDCGHPAPDVAATFAGCDVLVLEANHDPAMLRYGSYPPSLKRRIGGRLGHLANDEAAELLRLMLATGRPLPRCVVLAHLSNMNNRPALARAAVMRVIGRRRVRVLVAPQARALAPIVVTANACEISSGLPGEQLSLCFENSRGAESGA